jgi:hypothetical protein
VPTSRLGCRMIGRAGCEMLAQTLAELHVNKGSMYDAPGELTWNFSCTCIRDVVLTRIPV